MNWNTIKNDNLQSGDKVVVKHIYNSNYGYYKFLGKEVTLRLQNKILTDTMHWSTYELPNEFLDERDML